MIRKPTVLLVITLLLAGCGEQVVKKPHPHAGLRIIAMAPNTAEILYALGLSNEIAGVSRFCSYPPDVTNKPSVGGLYDPNWEMIVALQPNFVVGLNTQKEIKSQLKQLGIGFIGVSHEHIDDILQSVLTIGKACGAETEAARLIQSIKIQLSAFQNDWKPPKPRMLVCVGHDESRSRMYVAARHTFYDELIERAGGINACDDTSQKYPEISQEGLTVMNPDVVIDILPDSKHVSANDWKPYRAVVITNDYAWIPGPRFVLLLQDFSRAIHE